MARSHHRKKHREHVRQFRQTHDTSTAEGRSGKAVNIFMIAGALAGFAIGYFASGAEPLWMATGLLLGAAGGYLAGRKIDEGKA
ncbi:MAG: AtpZ/AtpI family protein [Chitinophagaceae bacterium]|nr:AtpZ/AtpI family protein [Chitinophagaceae bacterium]